MEHKLILGGELWLPFARSRIKALRATGLKFASQQFEIDGATIKVRIEGDQDFIRIDGPMMKLESGGIDVGNRSLYDLYAVDTCTLYQGDYARDLYLHDSHISTKLPAVRPSAVYARPDPLPPPDPVPYVYHGMDGSEGGGPRSAALLKLWEKKQALIGTLASRYSGKMRLFVQAIMGSNPTRIKVDEQGHWLDECYLIDAATAIYCDEHGIYWMIRVGGTDAMRMQFTTQGESIRGQLKTATYTPEQRVREEAYMFSCLQEIKPNRNLNGENPMVRPYYVGSAVAYAEPEGWVLSHGWHYGRENGKAIKVIHRNASVPQDPNLSPISESSIFTLEFVSATEKGTAPTISITHTPYSMYSISRHESSLYGQANGVNFPFYWKSIGNFMTCDAPIYGFYNANDEAVIVHFSRQTSGYVAANPYTPPPNVAGVGRSESTTHSHNMQYVLRVYITDLAMNVLWDKVVTAQDGVTEVVSSFTVHAPIETTDTATGVWDNSGGAYPLGAYAVPDGQLGAPPLVWFNGYYERYTVVKSKSLIESAQEYIDKASFGAIFVMVSTVDPDCVYVGSRLWQRWANRKTYHTYYVTSHCHYVPDKGSRVPEWEFDLYSSDSFGDHLSSAVYPQDILTSFDGATSLNVACITQHHIVDVSNDPADDPDWEYVFRPDDSFARSYMVFSSYGGAERILSSYSPTEYTYMDGAVKDAHLFIGYA